MITRGFQGRRAQSESKRLPPGQHVTSDFPVLSAGPTPHAPGCLDLRARSGGWDEEGIVQLADIARSDPRFTLRITLTRDSAPGWSGAVGRIDLPAVQALLRALGGAADSFVCGSDGFVEVASDLLMQAGQPSHAIRTERFEPSGD
jgi:hypothetical protein